MFFAWKRLATYVPRRGYVKPPADQAIADAIRAYINRAKRAGSGLKVPPVTVFVGDEDRAMADTVIGTCRIRHDPRVPLDTYYVGTQEYFDAAMD